MTTLFNRKVTVAIGNPALGDAEIIEGLRVAFRCEKDLTKAPNKLKAVVYNMSERQQARCQAKGTDIVIQAGYEENTQVIFSGKLRTADSRFEGVDWQTTLEAGDGEVGLSKSFISQSFASDSPVLGVVKKVAEAIGLGLGNLEKKMAEVVGNSATVSQGYAAAGSPAKELERLLEPHGITYSVQDGQLLLLREQDVYDGIAQVFLSPDTGLIGTPTLGTPEDKKGKNVLRCKCLLRPELKPGGKLTLEAPRLKGDFKVLKAIHDADTHGQQWFTDVEARPL